MFELLSALIWIVFFAIVWLVMWFAHRLGIKRKGFSLTKQNISVLQSREIRLGLPYQQAFSMCREALNQFPRTTLKKENQSTGMLLANSKISWESFGEKIVMNIEAVNDDVTQIKLISRPIVPTTLFDYGKNLQNVERIQYYLVSYAV